MPRASGQKGAAQVARVLDGLADGFLAVDGQGKIVFMNQAARVLLAAGADPAGRTLAAAGLAIPELAEMLELAAAGGKEPVRLEVFLPQPEGWLEVTAYPSGEGLAAIIRAGGERQPPEERLKTAFNANPHAMALLTWPEARFAEVNGAWLASLGFAKDEVLGKTGVELGLWDEAARDEMRRLLLEEGCVRERDVAVRTKSGDTLTALLSVVFIDLGGRKHLVATSLDISERRRAEEQAREQLGLLEDCSEADADATTMIVDEAGDIVRVFGDKGLLPGNPEGENLRAALPPPVAADLLAMLAAVLSEGAARTTEFRAAVGEAPKAVRVTAAPMTRRYRGRRTVSFRVRDITAEKAAEEKSALAERAYGRSTFFNSLVTGGHPAEYVADVLEGYGVDTGADYVCLALTVAREEPRSPAAWPSGETTAATAASTGEIFAWLARREPGWLWQTNGCIAALVPADKAGSTKEEQTEYAARLAGRVEAAFAFTRVAVGVAATSGEGAPLDLEALYGRAAEALLLCDRQEGRGAVHYADTGLYQVAFQLLRDRNIQRIVRDMIGALAAYDRKRGSNLLATLEAILEEENLRMVAARLFIHHNTAIWRKKRIEKLLGLSLDSFETRAMVSLYLKVWRLLSRV
ncbi:PAS domain S-box protein [Anaeroselena agilis]|uniref:PAS domain S-box protein n=1 Tax=Anaeroselena agilis TaxID=3063788 RepID=A0ABU3P3I7_9FIRM|nr:PAS domain S-box protein [Selenomonadales bacterium 4137-cl]